MKYYESKSARFNRKGLYVVAAFGFVALGVLIYYLAAGSKKVQPPTESQIIQLPQVSYNDNSDPVPNPSDDTSSDVAGSVDEVPYDSEKADSTDEKDTPAKPDGERKLLTRPLNGKIIKHFSDSTLQYSATYGDLRLHTGVDIAAESGDKAVAAAGGTVTACDESAGLGKTVTVDHDDGIILKYCGFDKIEVAPGDTVIAGQTLGTVGTVPEECADTCHLHLEATQNGVAVSPEDLF